MPISRKLKIFLNYFLGPVLFVITSVSIYRQVSGQSNLQQHWQEIVAALYGPECWKLFAVLALMLVNWGIEARKWQVLLAHIHRLSFWQAFKSVFSGIAFTMITPNRMGEFVGRVLYVPDGSRIRAAMLTVVSSASQMIITLFAGISGLIKLRSYLAAHAGNMYGVSMIWVDAVLYGSIAVLILALLFFFKISWLSRLIEKVPAFQRFAYFILPLEELQQRELIRILTLSAVRFCVFALQYLLLLQLFGVEMTLMQAISAIAVFYLAMAIIPTFAIAELGIRGETSLALFGLFSSNPAGIVVTTAAIWVINIILPAVAGSLFVLSVKLFRK